MRRTKIICTIGPASETPEMLEKLAKAGMNICRLNFSHVDYEEHLKRIKRINELNPRLYVPIAIMLDTQGPEIRLGIFKEKANLQDGSEEHTSELQSQFHLECRLLLEKKIKIIESSNPKSFVPLNNSFFSPVSIL